MTKTAKTEWNIKVHGWSGKPYTTVDEYGTRIYHPGTAFGWWDFKTGFSSYEEADKWLMNFIRTKGGLITDFAIKKKVSA